ncbi:MULTISPECIES: carboxylesterase family protein [Clostridium]|uniref:carboxylesterase family protein n=1 Tax=Clostridium TaxID=1485 RepID=UPI0008265B0D|nr:MULTISPECIES: carboxylesterase family protein [Clostridium]
MKTIINDTSYCKVKGIQCDGYQLFKGIRYAKAKRFEKPKMVLSTDEIYNATKFGYTCPQPPQVNTSFYAHEFWSDKKYLTTNNEDCLCLNIWKPDNAENLPVAIWIHGGYFKTGCNSKMEVDGQHFADKGIILVSINYRVGILGFLCSDLISDENGLSGNYGIFDQLCAIDWIHKHIKSFGGNPDDITLMGQSAGAMSVQTLVSSPLLQNCIKKAIMQSGGGYNNGFNRNIRLEELKEIHKDVLTQMGIQSREELMSMDAMELLLKAEKVNVKMDKLLLLFCPVIDGYLLKDTYENIIKNGIKQIPYLVGCTKNDMFVKGSIEESPIYKGCTDFAKYVESPVYPYLFSRVPLDDTGEGAFHCCDLWYSFYTLDRNWRKKDKTDYELAYKTNLYWANFIKTGNPNGNGLPTWNEGEIMELKD